MMRFADKIVYVTGSNQGIGRAIAMRFAQEGATLVVHDRCDSESLRDTLATVRKTAPASIKTVGDFSDGGCAHTTIDRITEQFGRLDVLATRICRLAEANG